MQLDAKVRAKFAAVVKRHEYLVMPAPHKPTLCMLDYFIAKNCCSKFDLSFDFFCLICLEALVDSAAFDGIDNIGSEVLFVL